MAKSGLYEKSLLYSNKRDLNNLRCLALIMNGRGCDLESGWLPEERYYFSERKAPRCLGALDDYCG